MTDNEIDKAIDNKIDKIIEYYKNTNDPITRKKEEIDRLKTELNRKTEHIQQEIINRQQSEIERLKNELHGKVEYIHEQQEVIDDLKEKYNKKGLTVKLEFDRKSLEKAAYEAAKNVVLKEVKEARAEAIREFAKEIKKYINCGFTFQAYDIDNLVKEMTEETNGN